jgi:NADPH:quinone reductase-like Zn-dependent oxidoreductase
MNIVERRTMKAVVQSRYGSAEVLELADVELPVPRAHEVLIEVRAASVNHADLVNMTGEPYLGRLAFGLFAPKGRIRGRDVAGRVAAVGAGVRQFQPGDEVFGELKGGTFAEYVCGSADLLAIKPANLTFEQAAAVPLAAGTALKGVRDDGRVLPGQRVLINGASGGVGTYAVQIAKSLGADVTAVCSTRNVDLVRSIGADQVIDYSRVDFTRAGERYDVILDLAGSRSLSELRAVLTPTGTLVLSSGRGGRVVGPMGRVLQALVSSPFVRQRLRLCTFAMSQRTLVDLTELIEAGKITPVIERTYPLSEAADAMGHFAKEHARAKIVIAV